MTANVLSIAGSDPSGGAGIQADLKTAAACGCYGMAVIAALTAQNTLGVTAVHVPPASFVMAQIDAIFDDIEVHAVKIGMLASAEIASVVADRLTAYKPGVVILDPVVAASAGQALATREALAVIADRLLPLCSLVTPNLSEAALLADLAQAPRDDAEMQTAARRILERGAPAVLIKGGHREGAEARDLLETAAFSRFYSAPRVDTKNTHGTGCTLSMAIACAQANGLALPDAVEQAKIYLTGALRAAERLKVGRGHGPLHHFWRIGRLDDEAADS